MSLQFLEGKLIKTVEKGDVNKIIGKLQNFNGYIRLMIKRDEHFEEGYLFFKNGSIIGYYYTYNEIEAFGSKAIGYIESMKNNKPDVELYEYSEKELNIMMDVFKEIFLDKDENTNNFNKNKIKNTEESNSNIEYPKKLKYYNIKLILPEGKPLKMGVEKNYNEHLEGYRLLEIFKKENNEFKRGYIIYHNKRPILSAYEYKGKVLFGKDACLAIKKLLEHSADVIIDIYEYSSEKVKILLESYPQMILEDEENNSSYEMAETEKRESTKDEGIYINTLEQERKESTNNMEYTHLNKEELLKKYNIRIPDEEAIENIIKTMFTPSHEELENIKNDLIAKISNFLKTHKSIKSFSINLDVYYKDGEYYCKCDIKLEIKKIFGFDLIYLGRNKSNKRDKIIQDIKQGIIGIISNYTLDINPTIDIEIT